MGLSRSTPDLVRSVAGLLEEVKATLSDADLLERIVATKDEAAFECLVWRYGSMVRGTCGRLLPCGADADDAFQATFLILFRRAASLGPGDRVGAWLHGVAVKVALRVRTDQAKRRARERLTAKPVTESPTREDPRLEALDREIARLPERYRVPLVLCELQGLSLRETADRLRCPLGTVASRLARGRKLLTRRLHAEPRELLSACVTAPLGGSLVAATRAGIDTALGKESVRLAVSAFLRAGEVKWMSTLLLTMTVALTLFGAGWRLVAPPPSGSSEVPPGAEMAPEPEVPLTLEGRWRIHQTEGPVAGDSPRAMEFAGNTCTLFATNREEYHVVRDPKEPARIALDLIVGGKAATPLLGIYRITGDRLTVRWGTGQRGPGVAAHHYPKDFRRKAGDGTVLWEFERERIAWGKPREGLQVGISADRGSARPGERVVFRIHARNASTKPITFASANPDFHYVFNQPVVEGKGGKVAALSMPLVEGDRPPLVYTKRNLGPGASLEVAITTWQVRLPAWKGSNEPCILVDPGTYTVRFLAMEWNGKPAVDTGATTLIIGKPDEEHTDRSGIAWGKANDGGQFGLRLIRPKQGFWRIGDELRSEVVFRNLGVKPTTIQFFDPTVTSTGAPVVKDAAGTEMVVTYPVMDGFPPTKRLTAAPGEVVEVHRLAYRLVNKGNAKPTPDRPRSIAISSGAATVHFAGFSSPGGNGALRTGSVTIEVREPDR